MAYKFTWGGITQYFETPAAGMEWMHQKTLEQASGGAPATGQLGTVMLPVPGTISETSVARIIGYNEANAAVGAVVPTQTYTEFLTAPSVSEGAGASTMAGGAALPLLLLGVLLLSKR